MTQRDFTPFLIFGSNLVICIFLKIWYPGEVASPFIIVGGASAIFFLFMAHNYEERMLSLLSFIVNNLMIYYILVSPDPCSFLVGLFLIMLICFHLFLWFSHDVLFNIIFLLVLLFRIFYDPKMGSWGFGLVTELMFLKIFFLCFKKEDRSKEGSRIELFFYLILFFSIAFFYLLFSLKYPLQEIIIHIHFIFTAAALLFFCFFAETLKELKITYIYYIMANFSIGYLLSKEFMDFGQITFVFLLSNALLASFFCLKAQRSKRSLTEILLNNNKEGIQTLLVVYFLICGVLLTQLTGSEDFYSLWPMGFGIQIGLLTILNYFFKK